MRVFMWRQLPNISRCFFCILLSDRVNLKRVRISRVFNVRFLFLVIYLLFVLFVYQYFSVCFFIFTHLFIHLFRYIFVSINVFIRLFHLFIILFIYLYLLTDRIPLNPRDHIQNLISFLNVSVNPGEKLLTFIHVLRIGTVCKKSNIISYRIWNIFWIVFVCRLL